MSAPALLPCAHCGNRHVPIPEASMPGDPPFWACVVECDYCGAKGPPASTPAGSDRAREMAIAKWNGRAGGSK